MRIWVDCTAAAHPLVLRPIIERLAERGHEVSVTAREYGQTLGILERLGIEYEAVGRHGGASTLSKGAALASRSRALRRWARGLPLELAVAHGSVDLAVVSRLARIPSVQMQDYEFAGLQRRISWGVARRVLVPEAIPLERLERAGAKLEKLFRYPGLKEDYYLSGFEPDAAVLDGLGIDRDGDGVLAVVRPPPETSAYHRDNALYGAAIDRLAADERTTAVVIPRTERQAEEIRARHDPSLIVPDRAIDAQSLIALADLVVGAGGTMNREAVAFGTPVYTIFSGRIGGVDERLIADGRMTKLEGAADLRLEKRDSPVGAREPRDPGILVEAILTAAPDRSA